MMKGPRIHACSHAAPFILKPQFEYRNHGQALWHNGFSKIRPIAEQLG